MAQSEVQSNNGHSHFTVTLIAILVIFSTAFSILVYISTMKQHATTQAEIRSLMTQYDQLIEVNKNALGKISMLTQYLESEMNEEAEEATETAAIESEE